MKDYNKAIKACPTGMFAEVKYDGERIQIHKSEDGFVCYSRNLKVMKESKWEFLKNLLPRACKCESVIFDGEILAQDKVTGNPLPFGTLGTRKQADFPNAVACVYIFDLLYLNGRSLINEPLKQRRKLLSQILRPIKHRIMMGEMIKIDDAKHLEAVFKDCVVHKLEGLVCKDAEGIYGPGKRHWLKLKKDYFSGMGDTVDLIVLGAYYGTGKNGNRLSNYLMGIYNPKRDNYQTVTKVSNGFTDDEITELDSHFKKSMRPSNGEMPDYLDADSTLLPDFVLKDVTKAKIFEIEGAEFSKSTRHTASNISIRFPRCVRERSDKNYKTATSLKQLKEMAQDDMDKLADDTKAKTTFSLFTGQKRAISVGNLNELDTDDVDMDDVTEDVDIDEVQDVGDRNDDFQVPNGIVFKNNTLHNLKNVAKDDTVIVLVSVSLSGNVREQNIPSVIRDAERVYTINYAAQELGSVVIFPLERSDAKSLIYCGMLFINDARGNLNQAAAKKSFNKVINALEKMPKIKECHSVVPIVQESMNLYSDLQKQIPVTMYIAFITSNTSHAFKLFSSSKCIIFPENSYIESLIKTYGGEIINQDNDDISEVTHIISDSTNADDLELFRMCREKNEKISVVTTDWIKSSITRQSMLDTQPYFLNLYIK